MADLILKQNDKGFAISFTWQNADGTAKDLSGGTVKLKAWQPGNQATPVASIACTVTNALGGLVSCIIPAATFTAPQVLEFELEESIGTTVVDSSNTYILAVQESA